MNQPIGAPKKRIYLINRDFQLRYTRSAVLVGLATTVLTIALVLWPLFYMQILRFPDFLPAPFIGAIVFAAFCNFAIIAWLGIFMTHRIAGPMFSLVRHMRQVTAGSLFNDLRLRDSDDLKYLARNYNEMVDHLIATARSDVAQLQAIRAKIELGSTAEALDLIEAAKGRIEQRLTQQQSKPDVSGVNRGHS